MLSVHTCHAEGTLLFTAFDFRYLSDNPVVDTPVEAVLAVTEFYVNVNLPARHNQYRTPHAVLLYWTLLV